jgi:hypothetical protein
MTVERKERILRLLLRSGGALMLFASFAIFLPTEWMARTHGWLGLGTFPASPLVEYLTRSNSLLYALHGGLLCSVASRVRRHTAIVGYLGWTNVVAGAVMVGIDLRAGMPWYWTLVEGPPVAAFGVVMLYLRRDLPQECAAEVVGR